MDNSSNHIDNIREAKVLVFPTAKEAAEAVAERMLGQISAKPDAVLGLATGQTPRQVYAELVEAGRKGEISFADVTTYNLDEYCGVSPQHPDSYAAYMHKELFDHTDFNPRNINLVDGAATDEAAEVRRYAALLEQRPADIQLLGLGTNGHIGFNEPGSAPTSTVRVVDLCEETLVANYPTLIELDRVPARAITMGIADILRAKEIIVLATGQKKAEAVRLCLEGPQTADCPGSYLSAHTNVLWFLDQEASAGLARSV